MYLLGSGMYLYKKQRLCVGIVSFLGEGGTNICGISYTTGFCTFIWKVAWSDTNLSGELKIPLEVEFCWNCKVWTKWKQWKVENSKSSQKKERTRVYGILQARVALTFGSESSSVEIPRSPQVGAPPPQILKNTKVTTTATTVTANTTKYQGHHISHMAIILSEQSTWEIAMGDMTKWA